MPGHVSMALHCPTGLDPLQSQSRRIQHLEEAQGPCCAHLSSSPHQQHPGMRQGALGTSWESTLHSMGAACL